MHDQDGNTIFCPRCEQSHVIRSGMSGSKQRYNCRDCGFYFVLKSPVDINAIERKRMMWLLYLAGANQREIEKVTGLTYPTVNKYLTPLKEALAHEPLLDEYRIPDNLSLSHSSNAVDGSYDSVYIEIFSKKSKIKINCL